MDKHKENEIRLENLGEVQWLQEVILVSGSKSELLNAVYKEISEKLGMDTAMSIYQMFKGQQINFPVLHTKRKVLIIIRELFGGCVIHRSESFIVVGDCHIQEFS